MLKKALIPSIGLIWLICVGVSILPITPHTVLIGLLGACLAALMQVGGRASGTR